MGTSENRPFSGLVEWSKANMLWFLAHILNLLLGVVIFTIGIMNGESSIPILPVIIFMCIIFVYIFTYPIASLPAEGSSQEQKGEIEDIRSRQRNKWMIFAYGFMLLSLLLTFYPFINPLFSSHNQPVGEHLSDTQEKTVTFDEKQYLKTLRERPIAVLVGCSLDSGAKSLACNKTLDVHDPKVEGNSAKPFEGAWALNIGGYIKGCVKNDVDNFGKAVTCQVSDGLLIPLYFIILALMGGSISLTRRLPELQKQAGSEHIATEKLPRLTQYEFREHLIFQMVQFISAPFLAVLAFYLIEPSNVTNSVALAFTAGFASETILLMVRSIANKITPDTKSLPQYGAVAGVVTFGKNDPDCSGKPAEKIEISLVGMKTITDNQGFYMLGNIPVGNHTIRFLNPETGVEIKQLVNIDRAQAIIKMNAVVEK